MPAEKITDIVIDKYIVHSAFLDRDVSVDCYYSEDYFNHPFISLLLVNDGQDLRTMHFENILEKAYAGGGIEPVFCVGVHCAEDRKNEYGTANSPNYKGRGAKAGLYTNFVMNELIPFIRKKYAIISF